MTTPLAGTGSSANESLFRLALDARVESARMWLFVTAREVGTEAFDAHRGNAWEFAERAGYLYADERMPNLLQDYEELQAAWEYGVARRELERRKQVSDSDSIETGFQQPGERSAVFLDDAEAGFPAGTYFIST